MTRLTVLKAATEFAATRTPLRPAATVAASSVARVRAETGGGPVRGGSDVHYWADSPDAPIRLARCPVCGRVVCRRWGRCKDRYGGGV